MSELNYHLLDVFTDAPFGGNPLAVFPDADDVPTELMAKIANELNLSETTFIQKACTEAGDCTVRIFTPAGEIPMAGHPTLGTAHAILANGLLEPKQGDHLVFDEGVGPIRVDYQLDGVTPSGLSMHQLLPEFGDVLDSAILAQVLSLEGGDVVADLPVQVVSCGFPFILVPLRSTEAVRRAKVRPDLLESALPPALECREILVFSLETERHESDVHCRMFAPRLGVPEDPATGGAHGPLGSYLFEHALCDRREIIVSEQGYEMGRPSRITVRIEADSDKITDVAVGGGCVAIGRGTLSVSGTSPA